MLSHEDATEVKAMIMAHANSHNHSFLTEMSVIIEREMRVNINLRLEIRNLFDMFVEEQKVKLQAKRVQEAYFKNLNAPITEIIPDDQMNGKFMTFEEIAELRKEMFKQGRNS